MNELILKKCLKCDALVEVLEDCTCNNCGIRCCGEEMQKLTPILIDEKEPTLTYEVIGDVLVVRINEKSDDAQDVEWVSMVSDEVIGKKFFIQGKNNAVTFPYIPGSTVYAFCKENVLKFITVD